MDKIGKDSIIFRATRVCLKFERKKMKVKLPVAIGFLTALMVCPAAFAQNDYPKFDIFFGYSLMRIAEYDNIDTMKGVLAGEYWNNNEVDVDIKKSRFLEKGFASSFTYNLTSVFGLDASLRYNSGYILSTTGKGMGFNSYYGQQYTFRYEEGLKKSRVALLVGPRLAFRNAFGSVTPFVYGLAGLSHDKLLNAYDIKYTYYGGTDSDSASEKLTSSSALGVAVGGGLDVSIHENAAIRIIQADYFMSKHPKDIGESGSGEKKRFDDISLSFGVVFSFGK